MRIGQSCPICRQARFCTFRWSLLKCVDCGLVLNPAIWKPKINEQMEAKWFEDRAEWNLDKWKSWFERRKNHQTIASIGSRVALRGRFLEIGVGRGTLLAYAKSLGFEVIGCDLSKAVCRRVWQRYGIEVHCGPPKDLDQSGPFDVIVMNHVLEHISDPVGFLGEVKQILAPGGLIHIAVPNVNCWEALLPGWISYEEYHLTYFTSKTLRRALIAAGFEAVDIHTKESFSGWFLAFLRTSLGYRLDTAIDGRDRRSAELSSFEKHVYRTAMILSGGISLPFRRCQEALGSGDEGIALCTAHGTVAQD